MHLPLALLHCIAAKPDPCGLLRPHQAQQMGRPSRSKHENSPGRIAPAMCTMMRFSDCHDKPAAACSPLKTSSAGSAPPVAFTLPRKVVKCSGDAVKSRIVRRS